MTINLKALYVYFGTNYRMENREWMYMGRASCCKFSYEWKEKTEQFVDSAIDIPSTPRRFVPLQQMS
jgi:hypothetical protein